MDRHGTGTVKSVRQGGSRLRAGNLVRPLLPRARRVPRVSGAVAGAFAALLATAAGWPGAEQPAGHGTGPAPGVWLIPRLEPQAMPRPSAQPALPTVSPLRHLRPVDLVAVSKDQFTPRVLAAVRHLHGVDAAVAVDAARVRVNGKFVAVLGVDPSRFRGYAAKPTARDTGFWRSVAAGDLGLSYTMGTQGKLPPGSRVTVSGRHAETLTVGRLGTVGIGGVDAVVSDTVADSMGFPARNAIVVSADPKANFARLTKQITKIVPHSATVEQMVVQQVSHLGAGGAAGVPAQDWASGLVTRTQTREMLSAAVSRVGMPYVWGAAGPASFDCSGLVQWAFRQAGILMPRVAADQARTGPPVPVRELRPGDLLFYHTDPTAPGYISHVAIYLGHGWMIQAPEPGMDVEIVPVDLGSEFAGAVDVSPRIAAEAAATSV